MNQIKKILIFVLFLPIFFLPTTQIQSTESLGMKPYELGKIPILTYHKVGDEDTEYSRSRSGFRSDLVYLLENGYDFISLKDFIAGNISTPKGKIPILLTFDDSSISQFEVNSEGKISPQCAIGIMEDIKKKYPHFNPKAVFFVNPGAKSPNDLFGQKEFKKWKVDYLLKNGYSIENHTLWHANLKKYSNKIEEQIAKTQKEITDLAPNYKMSALALPFGIYPKEPDRPRLMRGEYKGIKYNNVLVFDYSNRLSFPPFHKDFDAMHVRRIQGNEAGVKRMFAEIKKHQIAFISDGNPDTITFPKDKTNLLNVKNFGKKIITY
jgi:peptidoglycan/xylan/chitin deacetylase (PgdA/CDA1 family)